VLLRKHDGFFQAHQLGTSNRGRFIHEGLTIAHLLATVTSFVTALRQSADQFDSLDILGIFFNHIIHYGDASTYFSAVI
jgi:hypothetical protein